MTVQFTSNPPDEPSLHIDLGGRLPTGSLSGALLTEVDPHTILRVAKSLPRGGPNLPWVVWDVEALPMRERRVAAWIATLGRASRADVFIVTRPTDADTDGSRRLDRIEGHVARAQRGRR